MRAIILGAIALCGLGSVAVAQFNVQGQFPTVASVGIGYDHTAGDVRTYPDFGSTLQHYSAAGAHPLP